MMKKLNILLIIVMIGIFSVFHFSTFVYAETDVSTGTSKATIDIVEGSGIPPIVDPKDPNNPFDPNDPNNPNDDPTGNTGSLTLDYVSSVHFGQQEVSSETEIYESTLLQPFIQVSDRRGTGAGWRVIAQASEFKLVSSEMVTLVGSKLIFKNGEAVSPGNSLKPTPNQTIELVAGGAEQLVIQAPVDTGLGTGINRWFPSNETLTTNDNVTLEIPASSATIGNHESTITWTLIDAPGN